VVARPAVIGNYVIERELGRGGMGIVYAASHRVLGHPAAIKVLAIDTIQHRDRVERFFNEARAAMAIDHPAVVKIYDVGIGADDRAYIAMELLAGSSLSGWLSRGPMPIRTAVDHARRIAAALVAIHAAGIVHRDLKPDNIIVLDRDGGLKIVDFGIAKLATTTNVRTATGALLGTPSYMSPEQCEGLRELDARADLYSLGCVIFAMLTGRPPFEGGGTGGVIASHMREPPPPLRSRCPAASPALEAIVACLLAKSRDERYGSARAALAALSSPDVDAIAPGADGVAVTADPATSRRAMAGYARTAPTGHPDVPRPPAYAPTPQGPSLAYAPTAPEVAPPPGAAASRRRLLLAIGATAAVTAIVAILAMRSCTGQGAPGTAPATDAATVATTAPADAATPEPRAPVADATPLALLLPPIDASPRGGREPKRAADARAGVAASLAPDARVETVAAGPPDAAPVVEPTPKVRITETIEYAANGFSSSTGAAELDRIARAMKDDPRLVAKIVGHAATTEGGKSPENLASSRANAVMIGLTSRGVSRDRISMSSRVDGSSIAKITVE
jgi:eukaryotic-like serine/threonine-protein kinase